MSDDNNNLDDFDVVHLEQDDTQAIIDWAVSTAAIVLLMNSAPRDDDGKVLPPRLTGYDEAIEIILENVPDVLRSAALSVAEYSMAEVLDEEEQVEAFREELKDL